MIRQAEPAGMRDSDLFDNAMRITGDTSSLSVVPNPIPRLQGMLGCTLPKLSRMNSRRRAAWSAAILRMTATTIMDYCTHASRLMPVGEWRLHLEGLVRHYRDLAEGIDSCRPSGRKDRRLIPSVSRVPAILHAEDEPEYLLLIARSLHHLAIEICFQIQREKLPCRLKRTVEKHFTRLEQLPGWPLGERPRLFYSTPFPTTLEGDDLAPETLDRLSAFFIPPKRFQFA